MAVVRPIDANALIKIIEKWFVIFDPDRADPDLAATFETNNVVAAFALDTVKQAPTLDYAPVVHGEWVRANEEQAFFDVEYKCSECQFVVAVSGIGTPLLYGYKHCPNCGAKMDGITA